MIGSGFIIDPSMLETLGRGKREGLEAHIRPYRNGRDLTSHARGAMVIDLFGLTAEQVRQRFPEVYQHLAMTVRQQRQETFERSGTRDAEEYLSKWWLFGKPRQELRPALDGLRRYIVTIETMKHRLFQFLDADVLPDNMLVAVASDDAFQLGVLSSRLHVVWAMRAGGWLGVGNDPRYSKSRCFDPFPFPASVSDAITARLRAASEELDTTRKAVLASHPDLTLTGLYNVLEAIRAGAELTAEDIDVRDRGRVLILRDLHEIIDRLTFEAYGWPYGLSDEQVLERIVQLNRERASEEATGQVQWLRPAYQKPRFGTVTDMTDQIEAALVAPEDRSKPTFPQDEARRAMAISSVLALADKPLSASDIAVRFRQGKRVEREIALSLSAFTRLGDLATEDGGKTFAFRHSGMPA